MNCLIGLRNGLLIITLACLVIFGLGKLIFGEEIQPKKAEIVFTQEQLDLMKAREKVNRERLLQDEKTMLQERLNIIISALDIIKSN